MLCLLEPAAEQTDRQQTRQTQKRDRHPTESQIMNKIIEINDNLESKLSELESSLDSLSSTISSLESDIGSISSEVSNIESMVSSLEG